MTDDSVWIRVEPKDIEQVKKWAKQCKLSFAIGPKIEPQLANAKPWHIVRITSKDSKFLTMACMFGSPIIFFDSSELNDK